MNPATATGGDLNTHPLRLAMGLPIAAPERDPVCGMAVTKANHPSVEHDGTTYHFCSQSCAARFRAEPTRFLKTPGAARMEDQPAAAGSYVPLMVVIGLIILATAALALKDWREGHLAAAATLGYFMTGFFLVFAGFKLIDLKGFADGYATYDLLATRVPAYGYLYPFIELGFGLAMILMAASRPLLVAEAAVMAFSGLGVGIKLVKGEKFQCACLGTFLKVPLTKVTLIEDFGMAALATAMLFLT